MARFKYNSSKVYEAKDLLRNAKETIEDVNYKMNSGISIIKNAKGSNYINVDYSYILGFKDSVTEAIDGIIDTINKNVEKIEDYNNAPWYKKFGSTLAMTGLKLFEGIGIGGELLVDGVGSLLGLGVGLFSKKGKDAIGDFIKKDHVKDAFSNSYAEGGWLNGVEKYSCFSSESTAANIISGIGTATAFVGTAVLTGGLSAAAGTGTFAAGASAAMSSIGLNATVAGVAGLGSGTSKGLQAGKTYNQAFVQGLGEGVKDAGTVVVLGNLAKHLVKTTPVNSGGTPVSGALPPGATPKALPPAGGALAPISNVADDTVKYTAGTLDDLSRLGFTSNELDDLAKIGVKGFKLSSKGVMDFYDDAGNVIMNAGTDPSNVSYLFDKTASTIDDTVGSFGKTTASFGENVPKNIIEGVAPDGSRVYTTYTNASGGTFGDRVVAGVLNAKEGVVNAGKAVVKPVVNAGKAVVNKAGQVTTAAINTTKTVAKAAVTTALQNPTATGIVTAHVVNGIDANSTPSIDLNSNNVSSNPPTAGGTTNSTTSGVVSQNNYVTNTGTSSVGTTNNTVINNSGTTSNIVTNTGNSNVGSTSNNVTNTGNSNVGSTSNNVTNTGNSNVGSTSNIVTNTENSNVGSTNNISSIGSTLTDSFKETISKLETEVTTPTDNVVTENNTLNNNINSNLNNNLNNSNNTNIDTGNKIDYVTNDSPKKEYITNNYNTNNEYITNNYTTDNTPPSNSIAAGGNSISNSTSSNTTSTQLNNNYNSSYQEVIKVPIADNNISNETIKVEGVIGGENNTVVPGTPIIENITLNDIPKVEEPIIDFPSYNEEINYETPSSSNNGSNIKKVVGTVLGVGGVGAAAAVGYNVYKKYENGELPKKKNEDDEDNTSSQSEEWY